MILQAAHLHKLVNKEPLVAISTVTDQVHEVRVVQQTQHQNLHDEFLIPLQPFKIKLLHSNNLLVGSQHEIKKRCTLKHKLHQSSN